MKAVMRSSKYLEMLSFSKQYEIVAERTEEGNLGSVDEAFLRKLVDMYGQ